MNHAAATPGVTDIVITDATGSLDPTGAATVGAIVSNSTHVTGVLGDKCTNIGNCMAYCSVCLRTLSLKVPQFGTENWMLKVTDTDSGDEMLVPGYLRVTNWGKRKETDTFTRGENYFSEANSLRRFSVSLPAGNYTAEFIDENGVQSWPTFVEEAWQKEPDCSGFASFEDVTILEPPVAVGYCDELIKNGGGTGASDFSTTAPWVHTLYDWNNERDIVLVPSGGIDGSNALATFNRNSKYSGLGQDIDSRCLTQESGQYYVFSASLKITTAGWQPQPPTTSVDTGESIGR